MAETAKVLPLKNAALHFGKLVEIGHARRELSANIPAGTPMEVILEPSYWKHYTRDIQPGDVIEAFCEDGLWEASLRVMFVSTAEVKLAIRWQVDYEAIEEEVDSETHIVVWKGPAMKFAVVRKDTGEIIEKGLYPKSEAFNYLRRHLAQLKT